MKWTEGRFNTHYVSLGGGLSLNVNYSTDRDDIRKDLSWCVFVFGRSQENRRTLEEAKELAESVARELVKSAAERCGLRVLEEKE